ncbi:hypothetical protein ACIRO1_05105 [Streptomyces sp. NPDC102381]|uniref:hypothetical protein n=1 Tax=Streptomyces sp. NPDC102381 TaxID=3366164 RepID=UPI0038134EE2
MVSSLLVQRRVAGQRHAVGLLALLHLDVRRTVEDVAQFVRAVCLLRTVASLEDHHRAGNPDLEAATRRRVCGNTLLSLEQDLELIRADYVRAWRRRARNDGERIVTALVSAAPLTGTDLSPDGILLVAMESGVKALQIRPEQTDTFPAA